MQLDLNNSPIKSLIVENGDLIIDASGKHTENTPARKSYLFDERGYLIQELDGDTKHILTVDKKGNQLELKKFHNNKRTLFLRNSFDIDSQQISSEFLDANDQVMSRNIFSYVIGDAGRLVEKLSTDEILGDSRTSLYSYTISGLKVKEKHYLNGQLERLEEFNEQGKTTKNIIYHLNGTIRFEDLWTYDEQGNVLNSTYYEDGALRRRIMYRHLTDRILEEEGYDAKTMQTTTTRFEKDSEGTIRSIKCFRNGTLLSENSSTFNVKTQRLESKHFDANIHRRDISQNLEFDSHGNWRKKIITSHELEGNVWSFGVKSYDGLSRSFVNRHIEYYS